MKSDIVAGQQIDKIMLAILPQRRFTKMTVFRQKHLSIGVKICEITTAATGNANFFSEFFSMIKHQHTPSTLASFNRAH